MGATRAVMVGCGGITRAWFSAINAMDDIEVVGLVDLVRNAAVAKAEEQSLSEVLIETDLERALNALEPDVVFNCTIPQAHREVTLTALAHGCHVLSEKPLADSMEAAREMVAAAEAANRIFAVIQNRRYNEPIRRLRHLVASGEAGQLTTANCDFYIGAHFGGFRDHMEHVLLLDMAIHTFDQARFITGADPVSVYCKEWNPDGSWYDQDASAIAIFEMSDGLVYTYRGSWCSEGLNTSWECGWHLVGTQGSIQWDGADRVDIEKVVSPGGFFSDLERRTAAPIDPGQKIGSHAGVIREFVRSVRDGGQPETVASDNIKSLAMVFGAIESANLNRPVEIVV